MTLCRRCNNARLNEYRKNKPKVEVPIVVLRFRRKSLGLHRPVSLKLNRLDDSKK